MKRLLLYIFLFFTLHLSGQDTKPVANFKTLPTYSFSYSTADSAVWIYKGNVYGWSALLSKFDSVKTKGYATNFKLSKYKLKADSILNVGYASRYAVTGLARSAISLTTAGSSGAATYSSTTGALNIPQYSGGSMVYPGVGIALSTGTTWGTSITNNSANWNTAYGWGNHAIYGYVTGTPWTGYGYISSETDPTIYAWAKAATKPAYNYAEVGAQIAGSYEPALGNPAISGYVLSSTNGGSRSWIAPAAGGSMVYPGVGIALSTGASWGASIANASANWNTAYGWGNHAGLYSLLSHTHAYLSLSGGTLTGALSGTSASFSSSVSASDFCNSDIRLKNLIGTFNVNDFAKVSKIQFHKYNFISDSTKTVRYGVVAQEIEKDFPEMIHTDDKGMMSVNYVDMLVLLVAQQKQAIEALEKRVSELENKSKVIGFGIGNILTTTTDEK